MNESHLTAQAAEVPDNIHSLPAGRAGEGLREDPVPRHLHQGGAQPEDQAQRGEDTGGFGNIYSNFLTFSPFLSTTGVVLESASSSQKNRADVLVPRLQPSRPQHVRVQPRLHAHGPRTGSLTFLSSWRIGGILLDVWLIFEVGNPRLPDKPVSFWLPQSKLGRVVTHPTNPIPHIGVKYSRLARHSQEEKSLHIPRDLLSQYSNIAISVRGAYTLGFF